MAHRHKVHADKKARGGHITAIHGGGSAHDGTAPRKDPAKLAYTGKGSNVAKEAAEKKHGGKVKHKADGGAIEHKAAGGAAKPRLDKRARGGGVHPAVATKSSTIHAAPSHKPHTPGVHANGQDMTKSPFSAAHVKPMHSDGGNPHPHHLKHKGPHKAHPKDSHGGHSK